MKDSKKKKKKNLKKRNKNNLPVFDSDHDFLNVFEKNEENRDHRNLTKNPEVSEDPVKENFAELLEKSFKQKEKAQPVKQTSSMPLKRRLKRYPPVEVELDLHGFNAIGARIKARSFIHTCKQEGFFTLRIIVGKGLHSDFGPVLPDVVEDVVQEMKRQGLVLWFKWDKKKRSKSGAIIVYLKQFERFE